MAALKEDTDSADVISGGRLIVCDCPGIEGFFPHGRKHEIICALFVLRLGPGVEFMATLH